MLPDLRPISSYAHEIKSELGPAAFAPARTRLAWLPVHVAVVAVSMVAIARGWIPWPLLPLVSLVIGCAFAGMTFVAHETMHGAIVRNRRWRYVVGWFAFLPFVLSPRLWVAWHNRIHHSNANRAGVDPDANPTLAEYRASRRIRIVTDHFALGRRSWTGFIGLLIGFSVQSAHVLGYARKRKFLSAREHAFAVLESAVAVGLWVTVAVLLGPIHFAWAFVVPMLVANVIVMSFIMTNHGLSPLTEINDPLVNALTVTSPRWVEWLTLRFGYHVEHHLFPSMSSRHALRVRALILAHWPERYQSMPLSRALLALHRTARVYLDEATLYDPRTGRRWPALLPRENAVVTSPKAA